MVPTIGKIASGCSYGNCDRFPIFQQSDILGFGKWVINSVVECLPYKEKAGGSNPSLPIVIYYQKGGTSIRCRLFAVYRSFGFNFAG